MNNNNFQSILNESQQQFTDLFESEKDKYAFKHKIIERYLNSNNVNLENVEYIEFHSYFGFNIVFQLQTFKNNKSIGIDNYIITFGNSPYISENDLKYDNFYLSKFKSKNTDIWSDFKNLSLYDNDNSETPDINYIKSIMLKEIKKYQSDLMTHLKLQIPDINSLFKY